MIRRAIISVSDKEGLDKLLETLHGLGVEMISSGGTAQYIRKLGFKVEEVSEFTGYPEMPGGLVKTIHPKIHGGILGDLNNIEQRKYMEENGIKEIDLAVVNFYPFQPDASEQAHAKEMAYHIDVGGPALARAAAKASLLHGRVTVLTHPGQYDSFISDLIKNRGEVSGRLKKRLAQEAFALTSSYDRSISEYLKKTLED